MRTESSSSASSSEGTEDLKPIPVDVTPLNPEVIGTRGRRRRELDNIPNRPSADSGSEVILRVARPQMDEHTSALDLDLDLDLRDLDGSRTPAPETRPGSESSSESEPELRTRARTRSHLLSDSDSDAHASPALNEEQGDPS